MLARTLRKWIKRLFLRRWANARLSLSLSLRVPLPFPFQFYSEYIEERLVYLESLLYNFTDMEIPWYPRAASLDARAYSIRACLPPRHADLLTLAYQISSGITALSVVYTTRPWPRVISPTVARSASDFQRARSLVPSDVRHKSRFRFQFIKNQVSAHVGHGDLYFGPVFSPRICRINVPVRFSSRALTRKAILALSKQHLGSGRSHLVREANRDSPRLLPLSRWNPSHPLRVCTA